MSTNTIAPAQTFDLKVCCLCGIAYAVPAVFNAKRREDGKAFYCPNGHCLNYTFSEMQRLQHVVVEKQQLLNQSQQREVALGTALKKVEMANRRFAKRLESGLCPVEGCKRHFTNLQRHIATEHKGAVLPQGGDQKAIAGGA